MKIPNLLTLPFVETFTYRALSSHGGVDERTEVNVDTFTFKNFVLTSKLSQVEITEKLN